jgi:hypothetical protein
MFFWFGICNLTPFIPIPGRVHIISHNGFSETTDCKELAIASALFSLARCRNVTTDTHDHSPAPPPPTHHITPSRGFCWIVRRKHRNRGAENFEHQHWFPYPPQPRGRPVRICKAVISFWNRGQLALKRIGLKAHFCWYCTCQAKRSPGHEKLLSRRF